MEVNDIEPETDKIDQFQEAGSEEIQEIVLNEGDDEDVHVCRKCNLLFCSIQKYLEHKIKHDNYKVKYHKSKVDRRMIMPTLVQRQVRTRSEKNEALAKNEDEKENKQQAKKGRKGKRKIDEVHSLDLVITDKPVYKCSKCDRKFNREASLKRHLEYDHNKDSDDEEEEIVDDDDQEYKPNMAVDKDQIEEDTEAEREMQEEAPPEVDSLDQVIMAAALVEKAEAQGQIQGLGQIQICIQDASGGSNTDEMDTIAAEAGMNKVNIAPKLSVDFQYPLLKRQKVTEEDKASRRFQCSLCGNKFKELAVLKTHMLTHTNKRQFMCTFAGCSYGFKTKGSLKRHMRRHTGERPYPCELCGRTFTESGALTRHLKSRTPCTKKSDDDLPRYGKKWSAGVSVAASMGGMMGRPDQEDHTQTDHFDSVISIQGLGHEDHVVDEQLTSIEEVTNVLDDTVPDDERHLFDAAGSDGVEVVIADGVEAIIEDETIQQFVHTETVSQSTSTVCKVCQEEFLSVDALKIHLRTHLVEDSFKCQLCHFNTDSKDDFETHMFLHHNVQIRSTDPLTPIVQCKPEKSTSDSNASTLVSDANTALKQLLELPQEEGESSLDKELASTLYRCPVCNKHFRGSGYLKLHMRNHTGLRPHKCAHCDRSFITRDTLKKHMSTHTEDRNFKCGECGKLFKRLSHVREHIKIHSGQRPFTCSYCHKSFKTNNAMKVHLRTHTDILPYECSICHRRFREKGSVIRHTRMHTGEKPYECYHCGRRFAEHGTLNRHLRAKVSCKKQLVMMKDYEDDDDTDYTVLAEFSSVVADTQQYIVPEGQHLDGTAKVEEITPADSDSQQEEVGEQSEDMSTETGTVDILHVEGAVEAEDGEGIKEGELSVIEAVQVTDDYLVITDDDNGVMRVLDRATGEMVAVVPMENMEVDGNQVQTITMSEDGDVSTVTMVPSGHSDGEMITVTHLIDGGEVLTEEMVAEDGVGSQDDVTKVVETVGEGNGELIVTMVDEHAVNEQPESTESETFNSQESS